MTLQKIILLFGVLLLIIVGFVFAQSYLKTHSFPFLKNASATIDGHTFSLLVAKSSEEKQVGLSGKTSLPDNQGMIFSFDKPDYYPFWMKNMKFPIDIIYIKDKHIVAIFTNVPPPQNANVNPPIYRPDQPSDTVLEINTGLSQKYNFKKGDQVTLTNI